MSDSIRDSGFLAAVGILLAILIIGGFAVAGLRIPALRLPSMVSDQGRLVILLTDAPRELKHLNVTIDSVEIQKVEDKNETWTSLPFADGVSKVSLDLLKLQNVTRDLSVAEVPPGNYTKIRLGIENANATYANGDWEEVRVPPGRIDIIVHFEVNNGETTKVLIDMFADWVAISNSGNLRPVLKAEATVISNED